MTIALLIASPSTEGITVFMDGFTLAGLIAVIGIVAVLAYMCKTEGCGS
jgi:hypothetical protein